MKKFKMIPHFKVNFVSNSLQKVVNYGIEMMHIPEAWKETKGQGVSIGILDTGIPVHKDVSPQVVQSINFTDSCPLDLVQGHGTHTAGIICALETPEGIIGIAPKAKLYVVKSLDDEGVGTDESLANGINWCVSQKVDIISMSLGAPGSAEKFFPLTKKAIKDAYKAGIVLIVAAGNESEKQVGFPACMEETISVGAINNKEQHASFSNQGKVDFCAAGVNVVSTFINNTYASLTGSSMACPQIAGIAALIISKHKQLTDHNTPIKCPEDVRNHLKSISKDVDVEGYDNKTGNGMPVWAKNVIPIKKHKWWEFWYW